MFTSQCTIQPTITFHVYPSVSKQMDTHYSLSPPAESVQSGDTPSSRQWELVGVADSSQLGTPERIQELEKMKEKRTEHGMTMVANLLNNFACLTSCNSAQTMQKTGNCILLVIYSS